MTLAQLWQKACEHDGIAKDAKFVCFSKGNPWAKKYNAAVTLAMANVRFTREYQRQAALRGRI